MRCVILLQYPLVPFDKCPPINILDFVADFYLSVISSGGGGGGGGRNVCCAILLVQKEHERFLTFVTFLSRGLLILP
jgi:hypothetical protein